MARQKLGLKSSKVESTESEASVGEPEVSERDKEEKPTPKRRNFFGRDKKRYQHKSLERNLNMYQAGKSFHDLSNLEGVERALKTTANLLVSKKMAPSRGSTLNSVLRNLRELYTDKLFLEQIEKLKEIQQLLLEYEPAPEPPEISDDFEDG